MYGSKEDGLKELTWQELSTTKSCEKKKVNDYRDNYVQKKLSKKSNSESFSRMSK